MKIEHVHFLSLGK